MDKLGQDIRQYSAAWYDKMVQIWQDRLLTMGVRDTGALLSSVHGAGYSLTEAGGTISFQFLQYGIYVDLGTGNGYTRGNGGELEILNPTYRYEHHLGKQRERRPWFTRSWYISTQVLKEHLATIIGEGFAGLFDNLNSREH